MGSSTLAGLFDALRLAVGDGPPPEGFDRIQGGNALVMSSTAPEKGKCRGCGFCQRADCDGQGTVKMGGGFRECPSRAAHEEQHPPKWDVEKQRYRYPRGYRHLDRHAAERGRA